MKAETTTEVQTITEVPAVSSFKEIAMPLVKRGIPVIPVLPRDKKTVLKNWQSLATVESDQIEKWDEENPEYNVGAVARVGGIWMLDCDVPDLLQTIQKETGQVFPQTFSVRSNKGLHFYFKHTPASESLKKNVQLKDEHGSVLCDVKVHNGYVVGPGSIHPSGKRYEVVNAAEIREAPSWLVTWIRQRHEHAEADELQHCTSEKKVKEGGRDNFLFKRACKLRNSSLSQSDALTALLELNKTHCDPPMEDCVVQQKIESAYSYEPSPHTTTVNDLIKIAGKLSLTDLGNAKRLVLAEGKEIRYCFTNKKWFVWNGTKWTEDDIGEIHRRAKRTVQAMLQEAATLEDDQERRILVAHEQRSESEGRLNAMISCARSEDGVPVRLNDFDCDPMLFNCLNGTLDLRTDTLGQHSRDHLISKIAPVDCDPNAECPTWLKFLDTITSQRRELTAYLQRCVGYSLTGDTREHALFLLYGTGANGKSTFWKCCDLSSETTHNRLISKSNGLQGQSVRNDLAKLRAQGL